MNVNMYNYNTSLTPIRHKLYGRHLEILIAKLAHLPAEEQQSISQSILIPLIKNISFSKGSKNNIDPMRIWHQLVMLGSYELSITPPHPIPPKPEKIPSLRTIPYKKKLLKHRCCGNYLAALAKKLFNQSDTFPNQQESIICIIQIIHPFHKKNHNLKKTLCHIEEIAQKKLPVPHKQIEEAYHALRKNHKPNPAPSK